MGPREWYDELPSTQDRALELARTGASPGTRVVAARQTRGRGRLTHGWESPPGSLYVSVIVPLAPEHPTLLPLALGAAIAGALESRWEVRPRLKWPNDLLLVDGGGRARKLGGVLVDAVDGRGTAVAGVGVNVRDPPGGYSPDRAPRATSLAEWVRPCPSVDEVEATVVGASLRAAESLSGAAGTDEIRRACEARLFGRGRRATIDGRPAGTIVGLGPEGELLLEVDGERMTIRAGDLRVEDG